ncbi:MAG: cytochrome oxidase putative small subunit CydP [Candidatus Competibacter sp.]
MFNSLSASSLRREIVILVLIKIVLLAFLKIAFFSAPPAKGPEEQAQHLLGVGVAPSVSTVQGQPS